MITPFPRLLADAPTGQTPDLDGDEGRWPMNSR